MKDGRGPGLYGDPATGKDFPDNDERFVFFCRAVLETAKKLNFAPDIVHAHDWQAGLMAVYLKTLYADNAVLGKAKSILTIHNLAHQGTFPKERFSVLGLPPGFWAGVLGVGIAAVALYLLRREARPIQKRQLRRLPKGILS